MERIVYNLPFDDPDRDAKADVSRIKFVKARQKLTSHFSQYGDSFITKIEEAERYREAVKSLKKVSPKGLAHWATGK